MKLAYVLSGGGAKGAFQSGVLLKLENEGIKPDVVYGTSVGALNAAGLAFAGPEKMRNIWLSVQGKGDVLSFNWLTLLLLSEGIYNTKPLKKNFLDLVVTGTPQCEAVVTATELDSGKTVYTSTKDSTLDQFRTMTQASCVIPAVMSTVNGYVDGGVREQIPIKKAVLDGADKIIIISCNPILQDPSEPFSYKSVGFPKIYNILFRSIDGIMEHETFINDLQEVQEVLDRNKIPGYRQIEVEIYAPTAPLYGTLEFDPVKMKGAIDQGLAAEKVDLSQHFEL